MSFEYFHVDVFCRAPYSGNSLSVFLDASGLNAERMLCLTQELRHFEAIFLLYRRDADDRTCPSFANLFSCRVASCPVSSNERCTNDVMKRGNFSPLGPAL
jgi:Phenazine biosynthesis-like protein